MTKLGVQGGPEEEAKAQQDIVKDPKVFTVVQPTFVPIPIQNTEPMRKSVPSTWCLLARLLAFVLIGSLLFSLLVFVVWNKDEVARAITGGKTAHVVSEPQFTALNSQAQKAEEKDDGAQITIKQTDEGTQMIVQLPKASEETKDGARTAEAPVIPILQLVRSEEGSSISSSSGSESGSGSGSASSSASASGSSSQQDESSEMDEEPRRPMHPYEMEGPSPDAFNYGGMHPFMAIQAARAAQYENEMRAWRMRRLQQMLVLAAVQQAAQREAAMRYAMFQRQQWAMQQMAMQQAMEARRQAEWQEYWRRAAFARAMQQQAMAQQMQQQQQQPVESSWQTAEQPRPFWTQQQQPMMAWPQQQMMFQHPMMQQQQQEQPQQQAPMMNGPFWANLWRQQQQQPQPAFEPQGAQMQSSSQQQSSEESSEPQQPQPQPQPHAFIFIRRFFPIPQDSRENSKPAISSEESNENNIPLRPHDASAQQIVEQMRGSGSQEQPQAESATLPDAPIPGIHDRLFQHFQALSQQMQDRQSQPPLFASIPEIHNENKPEETTKNYDQDAIYEKLQRKAMELQQDGASVSVQQADSSASKEDSSSMVGEDDHDIRRGDAVLGANDDSAQIDSDLRTTTEIPLTTTTEPVMIENFVRAQSQEKDDSEEQEDELTPEEKRRVSQLDSTELKEAAALEASLEREANEAKAKAQEEHDRAQLAKIEEDIVREANKDSSSSSSDEKKDDEEPAAEKEEEEEPVTVPSTTMDPLSEFFSLRFFENEAVKLSTQDRSGERVVVDSETGTHQADEMPEQLPAVESSEDKVADHVSNEADIKVSQVANSREAPPMTIAGAA
ncbi:hypothetical protein PMAYCL1PPCAC_10014 [Pristionchus mayeri]|uniref:Uncharacterized protein n=1 Tax=Pristionchus mayeri TaxID=1317129 RepID=A0AAN4ZH41_9BILA|nr:hypothetical protein PMAYCL1PPCAC_10014 [Pristionchus mayeri]